MSFGWVGNFAPDFTGDAYNAAKKKYPTTVCDAIRSMPEDEWRAACEDLGLDPENAGVEDMLDKATETDTCSDLRSPVEIWLDPDGVHTVLVYDETDLVKAKKVPALDYQI